MLGCKRSFLITQSTTHFLHVCDCKYLKLTPSVGAGYDGGVALREELAGEPLLELGAGVPLAVLVAGVADDLAGEREELVAARQQRRHHEAQLRSGLVHANLSEVDQSVQ